MSKKYVFEQFIFPLIFCIVMSHKIINVSSSKKEVVCKRNDCVHNCQQLMYKSGYCINDRLCYCEIDDKTTRYHEGEITTNCDSSICKEDCVRLSYPGGKCADAGLCYCDPKTLNNKSIHELSSETEATKASPVVADLNSNTGAPITSTFPTTSAPAPAHCDPRRCDHSCVLKQFMKGICGEDDTCYCEFIDEESNAEDVIKKEKTAVNHMAGIPTTSKPGCVRATCVAACAAHGYISGNCIADVCNCILNSGCEPSHCEDTCLKDGYFGGSCHKQECYCNLKNDIRYTKYDSPSPLLGTHK